MWQYLFCNMTVACRSVLLCCCWSYVFCNSGFFTLYYVIMTACQWWKIDRAFCKTWGETLGEWQMACSRLAPPECSLPLWESTGQASFSYRHVLVVQLAFCCSASHRHTPPCFSYSSPLPLVAVVVFISWDVGVVPQPKSAITSCQLMLDKEMLRSVGYQAGSLELKSLEFLSSTNDITWVWLPDWADML